MLKPEFSNIRTIIFDIGNVLVDIDYNVTVAEFQKLAKVDFSQIVSYSKQDRIFDRLEKGEISVPDFLNALRQHLKDGVTNEEIIAAWNSILIAYPIQKFKLLELLKDKYNVFALSNINHIHADALDVAAKELLGKNSFREFFHHAYYSHEMGYRKPETEIYQVVLREQNLNPAETLFIDDKEENTAAAAALGIQTVHLKERDKLLELFI